MTDILCLRGGAALSPFRRAKLLTSLRDRVSTIADVRADFWHFVEVTQALDSHEREVLERILTYGDSATESGSSGALILITPRVGTL